MNKFICTTSSLEDMLIKDFANLLNLLPNVLLMSKMMPGEKTHFIWKDSEMAHSSVTASPLQGTKSFFFFAAHIRAVMASNLREINILTCFSGVVEKWGAEDKKKMRRREFGKTRERGQMSI